MSKKKNPKHLANKHGKHCKPKAKLKINFKLFFFRILSLIIIICCVGYILRWLREANYNQNLLNNLQDFVIVDTDSEEDSSDAISVDFDSLKQKNSDTVRLAYCK